MNSSMLFVLLLVSSLALFVQARPQGKEESFKTLPNDRPNVPDDVDEPNPNGEEILKGQPNYARGEYTTSTMIPMGMNESSTDELANNTTITTSAPGTNGTTTTELPTTTSLSTTTTSNDTSTTSIPTTTNSSTESTTPNTTSPITPMTTTTPLPVTSTTELPDPASRGFDGWSFFGGIILTLVIVAIAFVGLKYYKIRVGQGSSNYNRF